MKFASLTSVTSSALTCADRVGQGFLGAFDAQGRHNDRFDLGRGLPQGDLELPAAADMQRLGLVAQEIDDKPRGGRRGNRQGEVSRGVRRGSCARALDKHRGADHGLALRIHHDARDAGRRSIQARAKGEKDVFGVDLIRYIRVGEEPPQHVGKGFVPDLDVEPPVGFHPLIHDEKIAGLGLDFVHDLLQRGALQMQGNTRLRRRGLQRGDAAADDEEKS